MSKVKLTGKDLLMVLLYCNGLTENINEPIVGRTKITKTIFLFEKEVYPSFKKDIEVSVPDFKPYNYGPFSNELFEDLNFLLSIGLIESSDTLIPVSNADRFESKIDINDDWTDASFFLDVPDVEQSYTLSKQGIKYVEEKVWICLSDEQRRVLQKFKKQINSISLDSLLNYVYTKYPDSAEKSLIADRYI